MSDAPSVPRRFFTHNETLDFCVGLANVEHQNLEEFFSRLFSTEVQTSKLLEAIAFGGLKPHIFRTEVKINLV